MESRPPALDAPTDEVVSWLLGTRHLSLLDTDGRPLGERASPLYCARPGDEQHRTFGDSRDASGLPCNVAALRQLKKTWSTLLVTLASYDRARPDRNERILRRANAATALAPLCALRADHGSTAPSREQSALFKVTLGFREVLATALIEAKIDADATPDGDSLLAWATERGFLIGDTQVCAGTRAQIRQAFEALLRTGTEVPWAPSLAPLEAAWFRDALGALLELHALAASACGAARALFGRGLVEPDARDASTAWRLYRAEQVPRTAEVLRHAPDAGPLHVSLLFCADEVPSSLRSFIEALDPMGSLEAIDAALEATARPVAARLMIALEREPRDTLSIAAFRAACVVQRSK